MVTISKFVCRISQIFISDFINNVFYLQEFVFPVLITVKPFYQHLSGWLNVAE